MSYETEGEPKRHDEPRDFARRVRLLELIVLVQFGAVLVISAVLGLTLLELDKRGRWMQESTQATEMLLKREIAAKAQDRYKGQDHDEWAAELQRRNPELDIPTRDELEVSEE